MSRARELSQLANENALSVNDTTYEVGINSTSPDADLNVGGSIKMDGTAGVITATTYVGAVTGNVTGNCSGSAGSATGNAATATLATNASGLSGTPSVTVNLLTATDVNVSGSATIDGHLSVAGTITHEDVTQVDSVGIVTAGKGFRATTGGLVVTAGVSTFAGNIEVDAGSNGTIDFGDITGGYGRLYADATGTFIGSKSSDPLVLRTNNAERARFSASTGGISLSNGFLQENWYNAGSAWSTDGEVNLDNGMVQYNSNNLAGTNNTIDLVTTAGIKTDMVNGSICAVTLITAVSASTAYINHVTIDQIAQTESWIGGSAPTAGGSSGFDTYTFNIMRWGTGNTDFTIIANHVKTS